MKFAVKILMVALLICAALPAGAETFLVLGRAPLDGNEAQAKAKAVADALVRAVAQAAAATLDPATLRSNLATLDQQVLKDAKRFITNYSLVASTPSGQEFLALVSVGIDDRSLTKSLIQAALKLPTSHLGNILVMVSEETAPGRPPVYWWSGLPGAPDAPAPVAKVIKKMGLRIINPSAVKPLLTPDMHHPVLSESQALEFAREVGAQVVIIGSVRTFPMVTPQHVLPPPLVQLLAIETNEGQVVSMEETDSPVFHVTPTTEDANEVVDLVESSVRRLMASLAARMAEVGPTTKDLTLKVTGVRSLSQLMRLEKVLGSLSDLVENAQRVSAGAGQAEFKLTLKGSPSQLADQLMVQDYGDFLVNVVESDAKGLQVVIIPRQPGSQPPVKPQTKSPSGPALPDMYRGSGGQPAQGQTPQATPPGQ
ncbi:MAG: hypothetical protein K9K36_10970 [Desulfarculaceae bacterium]|nr:hypothetical protein [Desulfarculaceae bacterium]